MKEFLAFCKTRVLKNKNLEKSILRLDYDKRLYFWEKSSIDAAFRGPSVVQGKSTLDSHYHERV